MDPGNTANALHVGSILMTLCGGLALFLYGMEQMTDAMKMAAGGKLKELLARVTTNRFRAVSAGIFVTAIIQSSSVTTVLVVGFIAAGLMALPQSVGIILGADIGTTITAQIIAFKITHYALALVAIGFGLLFLVKRERVRQYGTMLMGLGLLFYGMQLMSDATRPLRDYEPFIDLMRGLRNPLLGILVSAVFTGIIQSSSATIGVVIVLAGQGFITMEAGIALVFGANIGTCVTAMLAALGKPREAVRAAVIHVLFKVLGVALWYGFIDQLAWLAQWSSPSAAGVEGAAKLIVATPRQIANAHTIFNVANTLLFVWFTSPMVWLVRWLVPDRAEGGPGPVQPKYLDEGLLGTPDLAIDRVRRELDHLGSRAVEMVRVSLEKVVDGEREDLDELARMDDAVDALHEAIIGHLGRLSLRALTNTQTERVYNYMAVANYIENIGDMIETNLVEAGKGRLEHGVEISDATREVLGTLHSKVLWAVERSLSAHARSDRVAAQEVMDAKAEVDRLAGSADGHLARRLVAEEPNRLAAFRMESDLTEYLRRIYYFAKRIAKLTIEGRTGAGSPDWTAISGDGLLH